MESCYNCKTNKEGQCDEACLKRKLPEGFDEISHRIRMKDDLWSEDVQGCALYLYYLNGTLRDLNRQTRLFSNGWLEWLKPLFKHDVSITLDKLKKKGVGYGKI